MRVLVVEDYEPVRNAVIQALVEEGFAVDSTADGEEGLWYGANNPYDLIILDIALPGIDGMTILERLRKAECTASVLMLTARDGLADRVDGLNAGADDYLVKPFALEELMARVRALVRRAYQTKNTVLTIGDMRIDTTTRVVTRGENAIDLTGREYVLLEYMAMRTGEVVTRTDVWEHVYDFNNEIASNVVDVYVGYLRKKIESDGKPRLIHTRRGHGYILMEEP